MHRTMLLVSFFFGLVATSYTVAYENAWKPAPTPLMTRWGKQVSPERVLPEYPRPQMARKAWQNLNGLWQCEYAGQQSSILVPFAIESALSGVGQHAERITYRRDFEVPAEWRGQRIWLRFGAVDWQAEVAVNGKPVGEHKGGYDPFSLDITDALRGEGPQQLQVNVFDPTDAGSQPAGKQHLKPEGIWYTPTTGIWQTVWLEPLPAIAIDKLRIEPNVDAKQLRVRVELTAPADDVIVKAVALDADGQQVAEVRGAPGEELKLTIAEPRLWSPDSPYLYGLQVELAHGARVVDRVDSYFGMRKIEVKPVDGVMRIVLNGEPLFQVGPLDQGFWPDGLYTPPSDEAILFDIETTKKLGYNMSRKHVKVEPDRWYYWCDKLGLLVWQDMPHGHRAAKDSKQFEAELVRMVESLRNHPSIVMWVVFNEGWGQHRTEHFTELVKQLDPARLVSNASGWTDKKVGDVIDIHVYPGPNSPRPEPNRAAVLGEFGGLGLAIEGHTWQDKNWSYRGTEGTRELTMGYVNLLRRAWQFERNPGMSAAVYTQLTDVEGEINGLLTYDREVLKVDPERVAAANRGVFPTASSVLATARDEPAVWNYTFSKPGEDWFDLAFDAVGWKEGTAGFGTEGTPGATVRTEWNTPDIWLRRTVELPSLDDAELALYIHHDEDVEVYINGVPAGSAKGYTTDYEWVALSSEGRAALRPGRNLIAVHCKQTGGGQFIDLGLVRLAWPKK
jgi:hypothetical protein